MADILLVNPLSNKAHPGYLPYGILYIAGFLREKGMSVVLYDTNVDDRNFNDVLDAINPKIVGFSVLSGPCIKDAVKKSQYIKKTTAETIVVWGGIHTTIFPDHVLSQPYIDYIIMNEGEHPLFELCEHILHNKKDLTLVKNLGYKTGGTCNKNSIRPFIALDSLPHPAWDLVNIKKYIHNKFYCDRVLTLHTSRGCPWSCSYCYNELVNFRKWRGLSAQNIIKQISHLREEYGIKGFQFYDDEFDVNPKRVDDFCNLLIEKKMNIKWSHYSRTNVANEERYTLEKKAGCCFIEFGVESGSPEVLKRIRKGQSVKVIKNAFEICHKVGLKAGAMFMVGMPDETKDEVDMTVSLVKSLQAHQTINTIFRPYPGSELFNMCVEKGLFTLPEDLKAQGEAFNIGNTDINVSNVDTTYLKSIYNMFAFNNILNEVGSCLTNRNFKLLFYYISRLNPKFISLITNGFFGWLKVNTGIKKMKKA